MQTKKKCVLILLCSQLIAILLLAYCLQQKHINQQTYTPNVPAACVSNCITSQGNNVLLHVQYPNFSKTIQISEPYSDWLKNDYINRICAGKLVTYYRRFARLRNVVFHPSRWPEILKVENNVVKQSNDDKPNRVRLKVHMGLWQLDCPQTPILMDELTVANIEMLKYIEMKFGKTDNIEEPDNIQNKPNLAKVLTNVVLVITRQNNVYFHNQIADLFNIFITLVMFRIQPRDMVLLTVDQHQQLNVDQTLQVLFGPLVRTDQVTQTTRLGDVIFPLAAKHNPLRQQAWQTQPYLDDFRQFVFHQYLIEPAVMSVRTCDPIRITILWQRDSNHVQAKKLGKIFNEAELYQALRSKLPSACVRGFLIEVLPVQEQLQIIGETDVLVAMHGEVLRHAVFMSPGTAVLEMLPSKVYMDNEGFRDYQTICKWRGLYHQSWKNIHAENDMPNYFTIVNATAVAELVHSVVNVVCPV